MFRPASRVQQTSLTPRDCRIMLSWTKPGRRSACPLTSRTASPPEPVAWPITGGGDPGRWGDTGHQRVALHRKPAVSTQPAQPSSSFMQAASVAPSPPTTAPCRSPIPNSAASPPPARTTASTSRPVSASAGRSSPRTPRSPSSVPGSSPTRSSADQGDPTASFPSSDGGWGAGERSSPKVVRCPPRT